MNNKKSSTDLAVIVLDYFPKDCSQCPCGRTYRDTTTNNLEHFCEARQKWDTEGIDDYTGRPYFCPLKLQEVFTDEVKYIMQIRSSIEQGGTAMSSYYVEEEFDYDGLKCVILFQSMGHRCGYVGVPKGHILYGKNYLDIEEDYDVHGGLTYSSDSLEKNDLTYPISTNEDLWWFGFDCSHCDDIPDFDTAFKLFSNDKAIIDALKSVQKFDKKYPISRGTVKTKEFVENECKHLAEQFQQVNMKKEETKSMTIKDLRKTKKIEFAELDGGASFEDDNSFYIKLYPDGLNDTDYNAYCISNGYMATFYQTTMVKPVHLTILVENGDEEEEE